MPFAMIGFFLGAEWGTGTFSWKILGLVILCMIFARSAAMAFNRYLDRDIDAKNARTAVREIPAGIVSPKNALLFVIINALLFVAATYFINPICLFLSPVALLVILGYSYTKRFTALCHFILGLGLALAPVGAFIAVTGEFTLLPVLYGFVVLFWVSGFDLMYALQDEAFDKSLSLHSVPVWLGTNRSLMLSNVLHAIAAGILVYAGVIGEFGWLHWVGVGAFISLLLYQHTLVKPNDLSKINLAFFTTNGVASVIFGTLVILDLFIG